jgi:predicted MFS family arabinose efflux permease
VVRVVNRLGGYGMSFLGVRLAHDLGMPLPQVGVVLAAFGALTVPSRLLGGTLAGRLGCRSTIVTGLTTCGGAQLVIGVAGSPGVVIGAVLMLGLAYELIEPATQAVIADATPAGRRASAFALLWSSLAVAGVIAGVIAALVGVPAIFLADAATSLAAAAAVPMLLPGARAHTGPSPWAAARDAGLLAWTGIGTVYATVVMLVIFMLPVTIAVQGRSPSTTGWLLATAATAAICIQRVLARLETTAARNRLLIAGHAILAAALVAWCIPGTPLLFVGALLEGASGSLLLGTYQAHAADAARSGTSSVAALTIYGLSWGIATTAAPLIGTRLFSAGGPTLLWLSAAATSALLAALHAARTRQPRVAAPT